MCKVFYPCLSPSFMRPKSKPHQRGCDVTCCPLPTLPLRLVHQLPAPLTQSSPFLCSCRKCITVAPLPLRVSDKAPWTNTITFLQGFFSKTLTPLVLSLRSNNGTYTIYATHLSLRAIFMGKLKGSLNCRCCMHQGRGLSAEEMRDRRR